MPDHKYSQKNNFFPKKGLDNVPMLNYNMNQNGNRRMLK